MTTDDEIPTIHMQSCISGDGTSLAAQVDWNLIGVTVTDGDPDSPIFSLGLTPDQAGQLGQWLVEAAWKARA